MRGRTILLTCLLVAACGGQDGPQSGSSMVSEGLAASLEVKVEPSSVHLVLHVTNDTSAPLEFTFPSSQRYDFLVREADGEEVWRWSADRGFAQMIVEAALPAGETWTFEADWDPGAAAGTYVAEGRLTASDRSVVQEMTFELP